MKRDLDIPAMARNLFVSTCELLKLNPDELTAAQKIRVDRASALRLQIDDLQSAQLRGAQIDLAKLIEASEALEHLLATSVTIPVKEHTEAREALATLIGNLAAVEQSETALLREENERLRAELAALRPRSLPPPPEPQPNNNNAASPPARRGMTTSAAMAADPWLRISRWTRREQGDEQQTRA
jgi:hypothetical protein